MTFVLMPLSALQEQFFRVFQTETFEQSGDGSFLKAIYGETEIIVRSFDSINPQQLQLLEKYITDVLFLDTAAEDYSVRIASIEILLSSRGAVVNVKVAELLIAINDILAVQASPLFKNSFSLTFGRTGELPKVEFPEMLYDCGLFAENDQKMLLETGFLGWKEIARQIREWIQNGYENYDQDVLAFIYSNRQIIGADSRVKWDEVFILPPKYETRYIPGIMLEVGGANVFKNYGGETTYGFSSVNADLMFSSQPRRRPDLSNFRVFSAGYSIGLFFEWDPTLQLAETELDPYGFGLSAEGSLLFYMPGLKKSRINHDVLALGAGLLVRGNIAPFVDDSAFLNDNDYLVHISPRLLVRLPFTTFFSTDLALGFPSVRLFAQGADQPIGLLTWGADIGLRFAVYFN